MELILYTNYFNIQLLREGDTINVWTQEKARHYDIQVSLDMSKYSIHQIESGIFEIGLLKGGN